MVSFINSILSKEVLEDLGIRYRRLITACYKKTFVTYKLIVINEKLKYVTIKKYPKYHATIFNV